MDLFSPANCFKHGKLKIKTIEDAINLPSKTLGSFKKEYGEDFTISYVELWVTDLNNSISVKNLLTESQISFIAEGICRQYPLKITDLTLFFRNIKEGVYGNFYESLSPDKILSWLNRYWSERLDIGSMMSQGRSNGFSMSKDGIDPEVAKEMFKGIKTPKKKELSQTLSETLHKNPPKSIDFEEGFMDELRELCKTKTVEELEEVAQNWLLRKDLEHYVEIIQGEIKNRVNTNK
ncbi:hypothetical protein [Aquimarina algiphila]|uniref:hypothetical protein n=1 Tax=Aquimarina algiphila TaxID=2047982 RepID=UPI0014312BB7|nr:hypothetical protein [Aquimarina algiphila]